MSYNVPDDWDLYYRMCDVCGQRTHASENYMCSCDEEPDNTLIAERFTVCSKTGDIKYVAVHRDGSGGIITLTDSLTTSDYYIKKYLSPTQIKWRNDLLIRLNR